MKRFDVVEYKDPGGAVAVVILQGSFYLDLPTVIVGPLFPPGNVEALPIINPTIVLSSEEFVFKSEYSGPFPRELLTNRIGALEEQAYTVQTAIDRLLAGY